MNERIEEAYVNVQGFREKEQRKNRKLHAKLSVQQRLKARLESRLVHFENELAVPSP